MARTWNSWARKPISVYDKEHCELTQTNACKVTEALLTKSVVELERVAYDRDEPAFVAATAKAILRAISKGRYEIVDKMLNRLVGRPVERFELVQTGASGSAPAKTFEEFCERAGFPHPYLLQIEMMRFVIDNGGARLLLGSRGYGKTDYAVILGIAWDIYRDRDMSYLLVTKSDDRNAAILAEIGKALIANGVELEKNSAKAIRVLGLKGKDHSVAALTIGSNAVRGRHPKKVIMDDPVTEEDVSEATRKKAKRLYNELSKLTPNITIIGQPVHKFDLYEELRPLTGVRKMEVPHGSIPELDHDLEAQRLAGVSEESIQASYFLRVISEAGNPLEKVKYIDVFPPGSCVAFIDPSFEGGDYTAMSCVKAYFDGIAVFGKVWKRDWFNCVDEFQEVIDAQGVQKICFETNSLGEQPVVLLRDLLEGVGVCGRKSLGSKHARILAAGAFAPLIHLAKNSDPLYVSQVVKYEYGAKNDDAPDSLASAMAWIGLIKGQK